MKKTVALILTVLIVAAGFAGCKKIIKKIFSGLEADVPEIVVTIPFFPLPAGTPVPEDEITFPPYTQPFNLDSLVKAKTDGNFGANDVTSVKVKKISFKLTNADSLNNLANFESARFTFSSSSNNNPAPIASFTFPDVYATSTEFVAPENTPELISYLKGSELTYNVYGKLRRYTTKALKLSVVVTVKVR